MTIGWLLALLWPLAAWLVAAPAHAQIDSQTGVWVNVTPANASPGGTFSCGNYGTQSAVVDPDRPSNFYIQYNCQGVWKSTDYGQTWSGPINTGAGGATAGDCAGGISLASGGGGTNPPIVYEACIRGAGLGFWRSLDDGVSWTNYNIAPAGDRQDVYPPSVDPYDRNHLLLPAHELNALYESVDGGETWVSARFNPGMTESGGTAFCFFINTGSAATTRTTWLYSAQGMGGAVGTWRTTDGGTSWTQVSTNEHPHGNMQIYQPDSSGVVYMPGIYGAGNFGVYRSADYGATWIGVGSTGGLKASVFGTNNTIYAQDAWACGACFISPNEEVAPLPGITAWVPTSTPGSMTTGAAQGAVSFNGAQFIIVTANWQVGTWRYVELEAPSSGSHNFNQGQTAPGGDR